MSPVLDHEKVFERAWVDPRFTRFALPSIDVNDVLARRYRTSEPLTFTRTMLWDMEVKKAWRPDLYIPHVVREGSADAWGLATEADGSDSFMRASQQRLWLDPEEYGLVLEETHRNHAHQKVTFIGGAEVPGRDGNILHAGTGQPLFHVEHAVGGEETRPLNLWRIVHLTERPDDRLIEVFTRIAGDVWLPEFIEIYIRIDLNIKLTRHDAA